MLTGIEIFKFFVSDHLKWVALGDKCNKCRSLFLLNKIRNGRYNIKVKTFLDMGLPLQVF